MTLCVSLPSSYDTWVSANDVEGDVEDPPSPDKPWKVSGQPQIRRMAGSDSAALFTLGWVTLGTQDAFAFALQICGQMYPRPPQQVVRVIGP